MMPVRPIPPAVAQNSRGFRRGHAAHLAVGDQQVEPGHVPGEAARPVMVLAVHVGGDRAADRDLPGARRDRHEPAERQRRGHQLLQAHPGLAGDQPGLRVEAGDAAQPGGPDDQAAAVLRRVVVAAAQAAGDHARGAGRRPAGRRPAQDRQARPAATVEGAIRPQPVSAIRRRAAPRQARLAGPAADLTWPSRMARPPQAPASGSPRAAHRGADPVAGSGRGRQALGGGLPVGRRALPQRPRRSARPARRAG